MADTHSKEIAMKDWTKQKTGGKNWGEKTGDIIHIYLIFLGGSARLKQCLLFLNDL